LTNIHADRQGLVCPTQSW